MSQLPLSVKTFKPYSVTQDGNKPAVAAKYLESTLKLVSMEIIFFLTAPTALFCILMTVFIPFTGYFKAIYAVIPELLLSGAVMLAVKMKPKMVKRHSHKVRLCFGSASCLLTVVSGMLFYSESPSPENSMLVCSIVNTFLFFFSITIKSNLVSLLSFGFGAAINLALAAVLTEEFEFHLLVLPAIQAVFMLFVMFLARKLIKDLNFTYQARISSEAKQNEEFKCLIDSSEAAALLEISGSVVVRNRAFDKEFGQFLGSKGRFNSEAFLRELSSDYKVVFSNTNFKITNEPRNESFTESGIFLNPSYDDGLFVRLIRKNNNREITFERSPIRFEQERGSLVKISSNQSKTLIEELKSNVKVAKYVSDKLEIEGDSYKYTVYLLKSLFEVETPSEFNLSKFLSKINSSLTLLDQYIPSLTHDLVAEMPSHTFKGLLYTFFSITAEFNSTHTLSISADSVEKLEELENKPTELLLETKVNCENSEIILENLKENPIFCFVSNKLSEIGLSQTIETIDKTIEISFKLPVKTVCQPEPRVSPLMTIDKEEGKEEGKEISVVTFEPSKVSLGNDTEESVVDNEFFGENQDKLVNLVKKMREDKQIRLESGVMSSTSIREEENKMRMSSERYVIVVAEGDEKRAESLKSQLNGKFTSNNRNISIVPVKEAVEVLNLIIAKVNDFGADTGIRAVISNNNFEFLSAGECFKVIRRLEKEEKIKPIKLLSYFSKIEADFSLTKKFSDVMLNESDLAKKVESIVMELLDD